MNSIDDMGDVEIVELHWMKESDLAMHANSGIAVPALCGAWLDPDPPLTAGAQAGALDVRHVSCTTCDVLHGLRTDLTTPASL